MRKRRILALSLLACLLPLTSGIFLLYRYAETAAGEEVVRRAIRSRSYNTIKHAVASARVYTILSTVGLPAASADELAFQFGYFNEWAEANLPRGRPRDSAEETYKDLYTNLAGAAVARRLGEIGHASARSEVRVIGWMMSCGEIPGSADDGRVPRFPAGSTLGMAIEQFERDKPRLQETLTTFLATHEQEVLEQAQ